MTHTVQITISDALSVVQTLLAVPAYARWQPAEYPKILRRMAGVVDFYISNLTEQQAADTFGSRAAYVRDTWPTLYRDTLAYAERCAAAMENAVMSNAENTRPVVHAAVVRFINTLAGVKL